jgi:pimeloyl-ACP methyl ester carboxylesterase
VGEITHAAPGAHGVFPRSAHCTFPLASPPIDIADANEEDPMAEAQVQVQEHEPARRAFPGETARQRLAADMPVAERRLLLAGIATCVLDGGNGPPVVLLHGPMGNATHWMEVIPTLAATHRVIVPDLPGHGSSEVTDEGRIDSASVMEWLGELIAQSCKTPPVLVGQLLGGAIAAHFASAQGHRLSGLVLVDTFGLRPFQPAPEFGLALSNFLAQPTEHTHTDLWHHCAFDLDALRKRMGEQRWQPFEAYNLDRARTPSVQAAVATLMEHFGVPAISTSDLARIAVPTTLIWGRHDRATPLAVAAEASARLGWPLHVIENCNDDPPIEQPEALLRVLRGVLGGI